ncbi:MAG: ABC transporter substrate-binding protein [Deltaproteobacteria bacterium HGW-Deltaproteobacteria-19]|jgi:ABC-type branched-subunit amino acid transport system substrate-binding protein|nr:MAG: ABC transporter substrate-binding protein [Deltaproteobacteria bacterium HGW-Deltaproteobacteria-19]
MGSKRFWMVLGMVACAMLILSPSALAAKPGFDDREIRIAQWGPQTGPAAPWGNVARGSRLLFNLVNEEGGIHGRKIKYFIRDDQYNPAQTVAVVKDVVEREGIFAFVGGTSGASGLAVKNYLAANKVIWVSPATSIKEYVMPVNPYIFATMPLYDDEASILTKYVVEKMKLKKIGILYQNDPYGKNGLEGVRQRLAHLKMKPVAEVSVEAGEKDLTSQIMKFKNSGAEVVYLQVNPTSAVIALKTAAAVGFKPQWVASSTLSDYALMHKITGGLWEGVITGAFTEPVDSAQPLMVKYREAAKRLDPKERWALFYLGGIVFAEPLVDALKRTGKNLSTDAVLKALNSTKNFKGVGPTLTWTRSQHQGADSIQIWQCGPKGSLKVLQGWTANDLAKWKRK